MNTTGIYDEVAEEATRKRIPLARVMRSHGFTPSQIRSAQSMLPEIRRRLCLRETDEATWARRKRRVFISVRAGALLRLESGKSKSEGSDVALIQQLDSALSKLPEAKLEPKPESVDFDLSYLYDFEPQSNARRESP